MPFFPLGITTGGPYQPLDADLTAIAALTTTGYGRDFLTLADASAARTYIGAGTSSFSGAFVDLTGIPTTLAGYGITDAQPLDIDLTAIAGLTPSNDDILQRKAGAWANRTIGQLWTDIVANPTVGGYAYTALPFTITNDKRLLGRDAAVGFVAQEIEIGTGLTLSSAVLSLDATAAVTSIAGTANEITASVGVGAVTLSLPTTLTFTGKTVTGGTFNSGAFNGTGIFTSLNSSTGFYTSGNGGIDAGPNRLAFDNNVGTARFYAYGPNSTTEGIFEFHTIASDGSPDTTVATMTSTGINSTAIGATTASTMKATTIQTDAPASSTSRTWKLGDVAAVSPTFPNRTIAVDVNGTTYYLHAKTTND